MTEKNTILKSQQLKGLPRQQQSALRKQAILQAAFREFTKKGFGATRIEDIAQQAGVSKGSVYIHFADKEALLTELVKERILPLLAQIQATTDKTLDTKELLHKVLLRLMSNISAGETGLLLYLIISEGPHFPRITEMYYQIVILPALEQIQELLKTALSRNELHHRQLVDFPQLIIAPLLVSLLWQKLFANYHQLDLAKMLSVHLDNIFTAPLASEKKEVSIND